MSDAASLQALRGLSTSPLSCQVSTCMLIGTVTGVLMLLCVFIHITNTAHQYRNLFTCMQQPTHLERQCWKLWVRSESPPRFSTIQPVAASHLWPRFGAEKQASKQGREGVWPRFGAEKQTSKQDREGVSPLCGDSSWVPKRGLEKQTKTRTPQKGTFGGCYSALIHVLGFLLVYRHQ